MKIKFLTKKIFVISDDNEKGFTTGGVISENGTVLIGCDDRLSPEIIRNFNLPKVTAIFCCDYRRSANAGILNFEEAHKYINEKFLDLLTRPELWWDNPKNRWHLYNLKADDDVLACGTSNVNTIADNEQVSVGDIKITALLTPGDTDYSMSYAVEDDGVKIIFCGGLLYKGGKVPYLYRLTKDMMGRADHDYHGFLGGISTWKKSLDVISNADILVPYLGGVIDTPRADIDIFKKNIDAYFDNYVDVSTMNYYFPECLNLDADAKKMERSEDREFPPHIKYIGSQCNIISSKSGNVIAIDCGGRDATDKLVSMIKQGEIKHVDALYITHYHDDHVDGCEYFRKYFDCPIYADESFADVIKNPVRYRLPCISPVNVDVTALKDGHSWRWEEFELTSFSFPGQTFYHDALMVKRDDCSVFFCGDSFSPTGIDDYCAYNRNLLMPGEGFFKCIDILKKYMPDYIINQHIMCAFSFTREQFEYMENNLTERMSLLSKLSVWDNINYALDEYFVMAYPYERYEQEQGEVDKINLLISEYADKINYEIIAPKSSKGKNIYGIRIYIDDVYLGQKSCFIVNRK